MANDTFFGLVLLLFGVLANCFCLENIRNFANNRCQIDNENYM